MKAAEIITRTQAARTAPVNQVELALSRNGPADELGRYMRDIVAGRVEVVPFAGDLLTRLTNALLPGTTTTVCGDPGVGKTFWTLQQLQHWHAKGHDAAVYFIEKDRKFHTMRLLAQLEGDGRFVDYEWIRDNGDQVDAALARHRETLNVLGERIHSNHGRRVMLDGLLVWMKERCEAGARVLVVDPITAADAGRERWTADENFMLNAEKTMSHYGASLILITHPKPASSKGGRQTGHDQAGGAAYHRFADTNLWLHRPPKPRNVRLKAKLGEYNQTLNLFTQLHKTRNGKGAGLEIGMRFGDGLMFAEQGVVLGEGNGYDTPPPRNDGPHVPHYQADPFAD